jgi:ABC-2 type transport system ATP-binding protein
MRFRPSTELDEADLFALPEVTAVARHGAQIEVTGTADLVQAVTSLLARRQIIAGELRIDQATLDDAFVTLTSRADAR